MATNQVSHAPQAPQHMLRNFLMTVPSLLAIPPLLAVVFKWLGAELTWKTVGIGALGWFIALVGRGPVALIATKAAATEERAQLWIGAASGPLEEVVRLAALAFVGRSFSIALSIGLGWAAIEVLFAIVNGIVAASIVHRTDEKAERLRQQLAAQGLLNDKVSWWAVPERLFACAAHIGFTLLLAVQPRLAVVTIPLHSVINLAIARLMTKSIVRAQLLFALIGTGLLLWGLALFGRL